MRRSRLSTAEASASTELRQQLKQITRPLRGPADLDPLMEQIGDAHYVLLGEASHGTADYYDWRATLSRRLITEKGFSFLAVEGDWPDCYQINRYVKGLPRRYDAFLYLDETEALHPLRVRVVEDGEVPETYPTGV